MDTEAQVVDPACAYHLSNLHFELYGSHVIGEDPFWVVDSDLYYQITPIMHHFLEFVSWLAAAYIDEKNCFVSSFGVKIIEVTS